MREYQLSVGVPKIIFFLLSLLKTSSNFIQIYVKSPLKSLNYDTFSLSLIGAVQNSCESDVNISFCQPIRPSKIRPKKNMRNFPNLPFLGGLICTVFVVLDSSRQDKRLRKTKTVGFNSSGFDV